MEHGSMDSVRSALFAARQHRHLMNTALRKVVDTITTYEYKQPEYKHIHDYWTELSKLCEAMETDGRYWVDEIPSWREESRDAIKYGKKLMSVADSELYYGYQLLLDS